MPPRLAVEELLARLIAFDSTSRLPARPIAEFVGGYLEGFGARVRLLPAGGDGKVNLWAEIGPPPAGDGAGLVLCGHLDVVPAGEAGWDSDPFRLTDGGDRWIGRGTSDMKGFLALAVDRAARWATTGAAAPLCLLLTCDEELGSLGAQRFVAAPPGPLPRAVVIGEPTGLAAVRLHKGHLRLSLEVTGVAAHSGEPRRGVNAIEPVGPMIAALAALRRELEAERTAASEHFPDVPYPALNVATIAGGAAVNVVPDRCVVEIGLRLLPEGDAAALAERVRRAVAGAADGADWRLAIANESPPLATRAEAPLHRLLVELLGQRGSAAVSFASDGGILARLGLDCVLWGPGSIAVAHRANEHLPKADLERAAPLLDRLIDCLCGECAP